MFNLNYFISRLNFVKKKKKSTEVLSFIERIDKVISYVLLRKDNDTEDAMVFMDNETYDQVEIPMDRLKWERNFIVPNSNVNISSYEGEILGVILPDKATLKIVECEQAVKGDTATSASKNAVLETGLEVKVPLFINQDELIVVNTNDGKYSGRAK